MEKSDLRQQIIHGKYDDIMERYFLQWLEEDNFEELSVHIAIESNSRMSELIKIHNDNVFNALSWFARNGIWPNLNQIMKSIPNHLEQSVKGSESSQTKDIVNSVAKICKEFFALPLDEKEKALQLLKQYKEKEEKSNVLV